MFSAKHFPSYKEKSHNFIQNARQKSAISGKIQIQSDGK